MTDTAPTAAGPVGSPRGRPASEESPMRVLFALLALVGLAAVSEARPVRAARQVVVRVQSPAVRVQKVQAVQVVAAPVVQTVTTQFNVQTAVTGDTVTTTNVAVPAAVTVTKTTVIR